MTMKTKQRTNDGASPAVVCRSRPRHARLLPHQHLNLWAQFLDHEIEWRRIGHQRPEPVLPRSLDVGQHGRLEEGVGPIEFHLTDAIGRTWQCGTFQLDYVLPERLDAEYTGSDGAKHRPVMLHRAVFGTFERFMGILIEQYAGAFPLWLSPVHVVVAAITDAANDYAHEAAAALRKAGLRVEVDTRNEKINYKVREHSVQKVPIIAVVGGREAEERTLALRRLGSQGQQMISLEDACVSLAEEALAPDLKRAE